jgi:hypothetical protein
MDANGDGKVSFDECSFTGRESNDRQQTNFHFEANSERTVSKTKTAPPCLLLQSYNNNVNAYRATTAAANVAGSKEALGVTAVCRRQLKTGRGSAGEVRFATHSNCNRKQAITSLLAATKIRHSTAGCGGTVPCDVCTCRGWR